MAEALDEQSEVSRLRRQEPRAFMQLVRDHERIVMGLAQSRGLRGIDLEEATADVFSQVWRALPRFEGRSSLSTWIYRIAARTIQRRRGHRARLHESSLPMAAADQAQGPLHRSEESERNRLIWQAVARLEPRQSMAVELFYRRGWGVEQIAQTLECPSGTVKTLLFRARQELKSRLSDQGLRDAP